MTALCALCAYSDPVMSPDADVTVADDPIKVGGGRETVAGLLLF